MVRFLMGFLGLIIAIFMQSTAIYAGPCCEDECDRPIDEAGKETDTVEEDD